MPLVRALDGVHGRASRTRGVLRQIGRTQHRRRLSAAALSAQVGRPAFRRCAPATISRR